MIMLGNLSIAEIERRAGVKFPAELVKYMEPKRQQTAEGVRAGKWHCFDVPFVLVCGDHSTAEEIYRHLAPLEKRFKAQLQLGLA